MKNLNIFFLAYFLIGFHFSAQSQNSYSQENVFVHTDRNLYYPGDTVYFRAYIKNTITDVFESYSSSLYIMLFNEQKEVVDSSRFKIETSASSGWLLIPAGAEIGKYHLVAFTSMMQNDDPKNAFQIDLKVDTKHKYSVITKVVFNKEMYLPGDTIEAALKITNSVNKPVHKQKLSTTLKLGNSIIDLDNNRTNKKGESVLSFVLPDTLSGAALLQVAMNNKIKETVIIENFNIPINEKHIDFSFLPEGGTLIAGLKQRIGFNATNSAGEPVNITGLLKNKSGTILDTIKSGKYGPGLFTCIPTKGMYVELINGVYENKIWTLNDVSNSGMCLSVKPLNNRTIIVDASSNIYNGEPAFIMGKMNLNKILLKEIKLDNKQRITIKTDKLPAGAMQISLLNKDMQLVAQRMIYVNADKHLKFNMICDTSVYNPLQETELTISVTDGFGKPDSGFFSISVANAIAGHDNELFTPEIEYTFNYHPYFAKNLPSKVLTDGLENLTDEQRDLLLMVYGWSKIHNEDNAIDTINKEPVDYDMLNIKALHTLKNRKSDRKLDILSMEDMTITQLMTDKKGEICIPFDSLSIATNSILLVPDKSNKRKIWGASIDIPSNKEYFHSKNLFKYLPTIPKEVFFSSQAAYIISKDDSILQIPEVIIEHHIEKEYNDEYEKEYQMANVRSIGFEKLSYIGTMELAIYTITCPRAINNDGVYLLPPTSLILPPSPALIVLDGEPLGEYGWEVVRNMSPSTLKSITVVKDMDGFYRYGSRAMGGVIFVNTIDGTYDPKFKKKYEEWLAKYNRNVNDKLCVPFIIYRQYVEFYNPTKEQLNMDPLLQERSTIYWNPEVFYNGKEPVKIKYPNQKKPGPVLVTVNGISINNLSGTAKISYKVLNTRK